MFGLLGRTEYIVPSPLRDRTLRILEQQATSTVWRANSKGGSAGIDGFVGRPGSRPVRTARIDVEN